MISNNNHSIGFTENNLSGSQSSNLSNAFLNIPRRIGQIQQQLQIDNQNDYIVVAQQSEPIFNSNVSFQNPKFLQKSEHKESIDEQELGVSRNSDNKTQTQLIQYTTPDRIFFNPNIELNREEQYFQLKKFQVEMEEIMKNNGRLRLISKRKQSENTQNAQIQGTPERSQINSSKDSFPISPQFKPKLMGQLVEVQTLNLKENIENQQIGNDGSIHEQNISIDKIDKLIGDEAIFLDINDEKINESRRYVNFNKITLLVIKFISKLLLLRWIEKKKLNYIREQYLKQIGDKASSFSFYKKYMKINQDQNKNNWNKLYKILKQSSLTKASILPTSKILQIFLVILILIYCFIIFSISVSLAYNLQYDHYISLIMILAIVSDLIMMSQTSFFHQGVLVQNVGQILKFHQTRYIQDIIIILAFIIEMILNFDCLALVGLQRIQRIMQHLNFLEKNAQLSNPKIIYFKLINLLLIIIFVSHIIACLFNYINIDPFDDPQQTQLLWIDKYLTDLVYSTLMLSTIGSQIQIASNRRQLIFTALISFLSIFTLGYVFISLNKISRLVYQQLILFLFFKSKILNIKDKLLVRVSKPILAEIRSYIEYKKILWQDNDDKNFSEISGQPLLEKLSINLYGNIIRSSKVLQSICSPECLDKLCKYLHFIRIESEETFIKQGQVSHQLIFIIDGEVSQFIQLSKPSRRCDINVLSNSTINESSFLLQQTHETSFKSNKEIKIAYLNFSDFFECIKLYQTDFEKLAMLRDNLIFNINKKNKLICPNCQYRGHQIFSCPFIYYVPDRTQILQQYNVNLPLERKKYFRNDNKRFNTRLNKNLIGITGISFAIAQKFYKEQDLTNEFMSDLQGSNKNFDESLFGEISGDQGERSSRNNVDRQYTSFTRQTDGIIHLNAQNTMGSNHTQQQQQQQATIQNLKVDTITVTERDSSLQSVKGKQNNSLSSIKVNVIKSNLQNDPMLEKIHIKNHKLTTTSAGTIHRNERHKLSYMSANPPQNPIQNISLHTKDSNSLKQQQTRSGSNNLFHSSISPGLINPEDQGTEAILENFSSPITPIKSTISVFQQLDIDRMHNFKNFFPADNADNIAKRYNYRRHYLSRLSPDTRDIQQLHSPINSYKDIFKSQTEKALTQKYKIKEYTVN